MAFKGYFVVPKAEIFKFDKLFLIVVNLPLNDFQCVLVCFLKICSYNMIETCAMVEWFECLGSPGCSAE